MFVCLCNALTDDDVARASLAGASRPVEVMAHCNCRVQCGNCARAIRALVRENEAQFAEAAD